jgi:hemerythrin
MYRWDPSLAVGVPEIDEQHRELFAALDGLFVALQRGRALEEVRPLLDFLDDYATAHFSTEEGLMAQRGFPRLAAHSAEHRAFLDASRALRADVEASGASIRHALRLSSDLTGWLRRHVTRSDLELAAFLRPPAGASRGARAAGPA